ncbi:hypothetical protein EIP86_002681 [Pleurotus ostreatoroseus]|nr:hypothetical protein EIP86_002681 [Pleurotus ostreatoroseus]
MAIILFSVVPHSAEVERLFSDLNNIEGKRRTSLKVDTLCKLARLRCNYRDLIQDYKRACGKETRRKHSHMHTRADGGIDSEAVTLLEAEDKEEDAIIEAGEVLADELDRSFEKLRKRDEEDWREGRTDEEIAFLDRVRSASVSDCFDLSELDNVLAEIAPKGMEEDIHAHQGKGNSTGGWSIDNLMTSAGL